MKIRALQIQQLDRKLGLITQPNQLTPPHVGWIKAIRTALGISMIQLAKKLSVTKQGIGEIEKREQDGSITLKSLNAAAQAMDMQLVYAFVPRDGSLDALIERKAKELATQIVMRTSQSMKLENQENSKERIQKAIKERSADIKNEMPKSLWD